MENDCDQDRTSLREFFALDRNYIILTNSGKPVFSFQGDMYTLSSIYATLYAMISKTQTYEFKPIVLRDVRFEGEEPPEFHFDYLEADEEVGEKQQVITISKD